MDRITRYILAMALIVLAVAPTFAATPSTALSLENVRHVLGVEAAKDTVKLDRREVLHPATHPDTAIDAEWWQAGFVKVGSGWRHADKAAIDAESTLLNEYRSLRDRTAKTAEGLLKLANWCQEHHLADQERAHLTQLLTMAIPNAERVMIYRRMGYRRVGRQWLSPAELTAWQSSVKRTDEQMRQWRPAAERMVRNWGGNPRQQKQAREELAAINQPSAIPTLLSMSATNESLALQVCEQLSTIPSYRASQGLAMLAVRSDSPSVRRAATAALKRRRLDDFAPVLLAEMRSPLEGTRLNSETRLPRLIIREEANRYVAVDVEFMPGLVRNVGVDFGPQSIDRSLEAANIAQSRNRIDGGRFVADVDEELQQRMDAENDRTDEINKRAAEVLSAVSGQEFSVDPKFWWTWWCVFTGTQPRPKGLQVHVVKEQLPSTIAVGAIPPQNHDGCLIAGSLVMTETGLVAIDQIQIGDRVLSKDITTGEVAYKPVLLTTVRQPVPVKTFKVADTTITGNDVHNFWVSGTGWSKMRDLKPELPIHTVTGMSRIESVTDEADPAAVYNLIVADFHTYFIGSGMILSHDVLQPSLTNVKVPGLDAE